MYANPLQGCLFLALHPNIAVRQPAAGACVSKPNLTIGDGAKMLNFLNNFAPSPIVKSGAPPRCRRGKESAEVSAGYKVIKARAGNRSARVLILTCYRCQGREKFRLQCRQNFSAQLLDKIHARYNSGLFQAVPPRGGWAGYTCDVYFDRAYLSTTYTFSETF